MSSASTSTASLVSNTTISSRTPLNSSSAAQRKDFQSAFASPQSTYGLSGTAPNPVQKKSTSAAKSTTSTPADGSRALLEGNKNFQSAFADLQSSYGFSGAVASPIPRSKNK